MLKNLINPSATTDFPLLYVEYVSILLSSKNFLNWEL